MPESIVHELYEQMSAWQEKGKLVVMTTQVANEGSNMTVYEVGQKVKQDFDLIEGYDMTLESIITKLMWIMTLPDLNFEEIKKTFYQTMNHDILFKES